MRVLIERAQHLPKQGGCLPAAIRCAQSQSDNLEADVGTAAFV
jgi:hypothetical protein